MTTFRLLLPPSETKRVESFLPSLHPSWQGTLPDTAGHLDLAVLAFAEKLTEIRTSLLQEVMRVSAADDAAARFKLGPKQAQELEYNLTLEESETLPALLRYTGVLYDQIPLADLTQKMWEYAKEHVLIHSALFGLIRATDAIPKYRYSSQTRIGTSSNKKLWKTALEECIDSAGAPIIDFRSKAYVELGPVKESEHYLFLDPAQIDAGGNIRSLSHFNKASKGRILALLFEEQPQFGDTQDVVDWLESHTFSVRRDGQSFAHVIID